MARKNHTTRFDGIPKYESQTKAVGIIPTALIYDRFGPFAVGDLGDFVGQIDQCVPCSAASIDQDLFVVVDTVGQEVLAQVLPDVFDRVEFG